MPHPPGADACSSFRESADAVSIACNLLRELRAADQLPGGKQDRQPKAVDTSSEGPTYSGPPARNQRGGARGRSAPLASLFRGRLRKRGSARSFRASSRASILRIRDEAEQGVLARLEVQGDLVDSARMAVRVDRRRTAARHAKGSTLR